MTESKIVCVVPSIRPERMAEFRKAWAHLFARHGVTLITVWDDEQPKITVNDRVSGAKQINDPVKWSIEDEHRDLICRRTDAVRNLGFAFVAGTCHGDADYILTLDDDVHPPAGSDPIQEHLDVLQRRVPISWMNTAREFDHLWVDGSAGGQRMLNGPNIYLRGFPYGIRDEAPVMVSHGVWVNVPDFDGRTQLELGKCLCESFDGNPVSVPTRFCKKCDNTGYDGSRLPYSLPYFRGPIPRGVYFPFCGMNVMVHRDALPYLYFAPMGPDSGVEGLNRFADIWCGILLKRAMDANDWAIYTGASTVIHTRASDPFVNVEQERLGVEWNEWAWTRSTIMDERDDPASVQFNQYWKSYLDKAARFRHLIRSLQGSS